MNSIVDFNQVNQSAGEQIETRFDDEFGVMWCFMQPRPRPCFNKICLQSLLQQQIVLQKNQGKIVHQGELCQVNYLVLASEEEGIFNLGGDLSVFRELILAKDRKSLLAYATLSIDNLWNFHTMQAPITTISLIQGQAMGGGFESALSAHVLIAEKSAPMGLPEVLFNLFPGMGALSLLSRKVGMHAADKIVRSGKVYTGEEFHEMGVVDVLAEDGEGERTLMDWVKKDSKLMNASQAINKAKRCVEALSYKELYEVTEIWVDAALRLDERNLKMMERLIRAQDVKVKTSVANSEKQKIA